MIGVCCLAIGIGAGPGSLFGFAGPMLQAERGVSRAGPGLLIGLFFGFTGLARWADRLGARPRAVFVALVCASAAAGIVLLLAGTRWWPPLLMAGAVLGLTANLAGAGLTRAVVVDRAPRSVGRASGVTMSGHCPGALAAPWGFGGVADATGGYETSWTLCVVLLLRAAAAYWWAHRRPPPAAGPEAGRGPERPAAGPAGPP